MAGGLQLSRREQSVLGPSFKASTGSCSACSNGSCAGGVGRVGVGKSSLINALIGAEALETDVAHGSTRRQHTVDWHAHGVTTASCNWWTPQALMRSPPSQGALGTAGGTGSDLVVMVIDGDISAPELAAFKPCKTAASPCCWWPTARCLQPLGAAPTHRHHPAALQQR